MEDYDLFLARQLQEEFDKESATFVAPENESIVSKQTNSTGNSRPRDLSVIDPSWETTDPNPDVRALFLQFNDQYFWGKLSGVEVRWSPRMTLCAGICHYEGRGGLCSVRLSVPLLKLRPRKDLVETLLHEMIHAYLFVTDNDRDRDGHGPNFQKHMHRINKESGANITIYHSFHDEVDNYRQHWWRCNGPCRQRPPYYGWVKRAMNRAPSVNDFWWEDHVRSCGGAYTKVKEPEGYGDKKKGVKEEKKEEKSESKGKNMDIRTFLGKGNTLGSSPMSKGSSASVTRKNVTSTITSMGQLSSGPSAPSARSNAHTNNNTSSATNRTESDFSSATLDWGGGIWTPEKNDFSEPSSRKDSVHDAGNMPSKEATSKPSQKKNWTVLETKNDEEVKLRSGSSDKMSSNKSESTGQVLGRNNGDGLNWLARMRKQWVSEDKNNKNGSKSASSPPKTNSTYCSKSVSSPQKTHVNSLLCQQSEKEMVKSVNTAEVAGPFHQRTQCAGRGKSISVTNGTESVNCGQHSSFPSSASDVSLHSSFHVSSCEEDDWPTPEKYKCKRENKTAKQSSTEKLNRKRTFIDITSSDEEDFDLHTVSKGAKSHTKTNCSGHGKKTESDYRTQAQLKDTKKTEKTNMGGKTKSLSEVTRGTAKKTRDTETEIFIGTDGTTSELETTSSTSEAASGNTEVASGVSEEYTSPGPLVECPACQRKVPTGDINAHLDICLS